MQTVWIVTEGKTPLMKAYSTMQEARRAFDASNSGIMTQLTVDESMRTMWVVRDILEGRDILTFPDRDEAVKYRNNRFQVMDRVKYFGGRETESAV